MLLVKNTNKGEEQFLQSAVYTPIFFAGSFFPLAPVTALPALKSPAPRQKKNRPFGRLFNVLAAAYCFTNFRTAPSPVFRMYTPLARPSAAR